MMVVMAVVCLLLFRVFRRNQWLVSPGVRSPPGDAGRRPA